ncbi:MAG TPA: S8 family serine peptidase [Euzebyales bacterium]|nr:S8 family serine peptidase [Euzebyales bacterium]
MMRAAARCSRPARRGILLLVVLVKLFPPAVAHATPEDDDAVADAQRVVVTFATDTTPAEQAAALDDAGADTATVDLAEQAAGDHAERAGVLVVASSGNAGTTDRTWPAADPRALAVAALDGTACAPYSSHGEWVDVAAPGCKPANRSRSGTHTFCGTSSAAPRPDPYAEPAPAPAPAPTPAPTPTPAPAPAGGGFSDIAGNITMADSGITTGCGPTTFCPDATVTRAQMASFLVRALEL